MDFNDTPSEAAFRAEARAFLEQYAAPKSNAPRDDSPTAASPTEAMARAKACFDAATSNGIFPPAKNSGSILPSATLASVTVGSVPPRP